MMKTLRWTALALTLTLLATPLAAATTPGVSLGPYINYCNNELGPGGDDVWVILVGADTNNEGNGWAVCVTDSSIIVHQLGLPAGAIGAVFDASSCTRTTPCFTILSATGAYVILTNGGTLACVGAFCPQVIAIVLADGIPVTITTP